MTCNDKKTVIFSKLTFLYHNVLVVSYFLFHYPRHLHYTLIVHFLASQSDSCPHNFKRILQY